MAYPDTITITIAPSTTRVMQRVNQDNYGSEYVYNDSVEAIVMKIRHSEDSPDGDGISMKRHNVFMERVVYPTPTTLLRKYTSTVTLRHGKYDDPVASATLATGLNAWLATSTNAADLAAGKN